MIRLLHEPLSEEIRELVDSAKTFVTLVGPWIKSDALALVLGVRCRVLFRGEAEDLLGKTTDIESIELLLRSAADVRRLGDLHAKVFIVDGTSPILVTIWNRLGSSHALGRSGLRTHPWRGIASVRTCRSVYSGNPSIPRT